MKYGFTILELMIALVISSLVGMSLYQMFFQTSRTVKKIVNVMHMDEPIYPLYNQLQNDITGMFAPRAMVNFYLKKLADADKKNQPAESKAETENKTEPLKTDQNEAEKKQEHVKNVFFIETKESGYLFLSFITTAGITHLEPNGTLAPHDFMRRVAYVFQNDPMHPGTLMLSYRISNQDLGIDNIKKPDFYPSFKILEGIKNVSIEFTIFEPQPVDKKDKAKESSKIVLKEWKEEEIFEKYKALLPAYITIKSSFVDESGRAAPHTFEFDFKVHSYSNYELPKPAVKPAAPSAPSESEKTPSSGGSTMEQISKFFEGTFNKKNDDTSK